MIPMEELPFIQRCMKIITAPGEFFKKPLDKNVVPAIIHLALVIVATIITMSIGSIISGVIIAPLALIGTGDVLSKIMVAAVSVFSGFIGAVWSLVLGIIFGIPLMIIFTLIGALITHLFLYLLGAKGGWERTFKVVCYISTFQIVIVALNIIPIIGMVIGGLVGIYVLYVTIQAYSLQHRISMLRATLAVILPIVIFTIIVVVIAILALVAGVALMSILGPTMAGTTAGV